MRMLMSVGFPHDTFNAAVRSGKVGQQLQEMLDAAKPEAVYFTESDGRRGLLMVVQVDDSSQIPSLAEPWFLRFNAQCRFQIAMNQEDLGRAGLDELAKRWG